MIPFEHTTKTPQTPLAPLKRAQYVDQLFTAASGKKVKLRQVVTPQDGMLHLVPSGMYRNNYPIGPSGINISGWSFKLNKYTFCFVDGSGDTTTSFKKAIISYFHALGQPESVIATLKAVHPRKERQDKNINTNYPHIGISSRARINQGVLVNLQYYIRVRRGVTNGEQFARDIRIDITNIQSINQAFSKAVQILKLIDEQNVTTQKDAIGIWQAIQRGAIKVPALQPPATLHQELVDNQKMRISMLEGKGWTNPRTDEPIVGY